MPPTLDHTLINLSFLIQSSKQYYCRVQVPTLTKQFYMPLFLPYLYFEYKRVSAFKKTETLMRKFSRAALSGELFQSSYIRLDALLLNTTFNMIPNRNHCERSNEIICLVTLLYPTKIPLRTKALYSCGCGGGVILQGNLSPCCPVLSANLLGRRSVF